jgi:hypothetical protein
LVDEGRALALLLAQRALEALYVERGLSVARIEPRTLNASLLEGTREGLGVELSGGELTLKRSAPHLLLSLKQGERPLSALNISLALAQLSALSAQLSVEALERLTPPLTTLWGALRVRRLITR